MSSLNFIFCLKLWGFGVICGGFPFFILIMTITLLMWGEVSEDTQVYFLCCRRGNVRPRGGLAGEK